MDLKNKSYFTSKNERIWEQQRIAIQDKQAVAKPQASPTELGVGTSNESPAEATGSSERRRLPPPAARRSLARLPREACPGGCAGVCTPREHGASAPPAGLPATRPTAFPAFGFAGDPEPTNVRRDR